LKSNLFREADKKELDQYNKSIQEQQALYSTENKQISKQLNQTTNLNFNSTTWK
jgi:hypothetical protein